MCGIAGILRVYEPGEPVPPPLVSIPEGWLDILDDSIKHRGPDGRGRFRDRVIRREDGATVDVALVHRRLSILDHAGGHQPMVSVQKGAGVIAAKRASGHGWLLYETPDDPALHAWAERLSDSANQRAGSASDRTDSRAAPDATHRLEGGAPQHGPEARATQSHGDDLIAIIFNGCIYNHRELRRELQAAGHVFTSDHSDTEVLVHGAREHPDGGLFAGRYPEGMFAVAAWNSSEATVVLATDRFGQRPIYTTPTKDRSFVAFASTASALVRLNAARRQSVRLNPQGMVDWIRFGHDPNDAPLLDTQPVTFGRIVHWPYHRPGGIAPTFVLPPRHPSRSTRHGGDDWKRFIENAGPDELVRLVIEAIERSVASMIDADVSVAAFLSGGIDSSLVCVAAARVRPNLAAVTVKMPSEGLDESPYAARIAKQLGLNHHIIDTDPQPGRDLLQIIEGFGLPFGDSSLLPTYWASRAARRECSVVLTGDGGDELFIGYSRMSAARKLRAPRALGSLLGFVPARYAGSRLPKLASAIRLALYEELVAIVPASMLFQLCRSASELGVWGHHATDIDTARELELEHSLPGDMLRKVDTAAMAVALETRAPFLDGALADLALAISAKRLMPHGQRKGLLKQVARKYLPADIVDRPKQGFAIPIGEWFRSDYGGLRQMLLDHLLGPEPFGPDSLGINSMINMGFVKQMLKEHDDAGSASIWPWKGRDHSQRLYMLLVLSIWAKWLGGLGGLGGSSGTERLR